MPPLFRKLTAFLFLAATLTALPQSYAEDVDDADEVARDLASAKDGETHDFASLDWTEGIHLIAGFGLNFSTYKSDIRREQIGVGSNLRTDIGYYFENGLGLELSSSVMFNRVPQGLIWNSAFMVGLRFAVPPIIPIENVVPYMRVFAGRSTNVVNYDGHPEPPFDNAQRIQFEGNITGLGLGHFQRGESGRVWYFEFTLERHQHTKVEAITDNNGVPEVVGGADESHHGTLYAFCLTFGAIAF